MTAEAELKGEVETQVSRVKKGGERFELLKADAEAQLEGANNRLGEVGCYDLRNSFFAVALNFGSFFAAATMLCN